MKPIRELLATILESFNGLVADTVTRDLFSARLRLWADAPTLYETANDFIGIIAPHARQINTLIDIIGQSATDGAATYRRKTTYNKGATVTTTHTGTDTTTNSERTDNGTQYIYPTGYIGGTDKAYISSQTEDTQGENTVTLGRNMTDTQTGSGADSDIESALDLSVFAEVNPSLTAQLVGLVEACVFDIVCPILGGCK